MTSEYELPTGFGFDASLCIFSEFTTSPEYALQSIFGGFGHNPKVRKAPEHMLIAFQIKPADRISLSGAETRDL